MGSFSEEGKKIPTHHPISNARKNSRKPEEGLGGGGWAKAIGWETKSQGSLGLRKV